MYLRSEILVNVNGTQEEAYLLRAYVSAFLFRGYYDWYKLCKDGFLSPGLKLILIDSHTDIRNSHTEFWLSGNATTSSLTHSFLPRFIA